MSRKIKLIWDFRGPDFRKNSRTSWNSFKRIHRSWKITNKYNRIWSVSRNAS